MNIEWLIADVIAVGFAARAKTTMLYGDLDFSVNSGHFRGQGSTLWYVRKSFFEPWDFTINHITKIDWLITNITALGNPTMGTLFLEGASLSQQIEIALIL